MRTQGNSHLSPFINNRAAVLLALEAGCEQEPVAGQLLIISGEIFSENAVNITMASNTTSSNSTSSHHDDGLSTGAKIGIGVGLGGLFFVAFVLFAIYWCRQRRFEQEENADTHPYGFRGQYYYPKEPDSGPATMTTAQNYVLQNYTVDYKSQVSGPTPEPEPEFHQDDPGDFINNAEYYDRLEGKSRGRPLKALPLRLHPTGNVSDNGSSIGTSTVVGNSENDNSALPIHPAYIPRSHFPGQLGGRASRNGTRGGPSGGSASQRSSSTVSSSAAATAARQQEWRKSNKPDSYAIQVYLNAQEEPKISPAPPRNLQLQLTGRASNSYDTQGGSQQPQFSPPSVPTNGRGTPVPPPPPQGGRGTPAPMQFKAGSVGLEAERTQAAPRLTSLILPPVPRIRVPGKKAPLPSRTEEPVPINRDMAINNSHISGPLAFPDSRFSMRPAQDRIVEQTADRGGQFMEVPIGSGKSYLYG